MPRLATTMEAVSAAVIAETGRGSVRQCWYWSKEPGFPEKGDDGWDLDNVMEWLATHHPPRDQKPAESDRKTDSWKEELDRQRALQLRDQRRKERRELVEAHVVVSMFDVFGVELAAQLDQMEIDVSKLLPAGKKTIGKEAIRKRCNQCRTSLADLLNEWARFVEGQETLLDEPPEQSDQSSGSDTKSGSQKTTTSRAQSARTRGRTKSQTDSATGSAPSKPSKKKRPKKSS